MPLNLQAKFDRFAHPCHKFIQGSGLGVASRKGWNRSDKIALGITLNNHVKLAGHRYLYRGILRLSERPNNWGEGKCSAGNLKPHVMATFPLERYAEALALVKDRKVIGKVVLTTA